MTYEEVVSALKEHAKGRDRLIVAIAGPPAAGKSTVAAQMAKDLPDAQAVPMDGFHYDNDRLQQMGRQHRKGAPDTFDLTGLTALLAQLKAGACPAFPTFDRNKDCVVPRGGQIDPATRILLVEGNYLLLQSEGWADLAPFWDVSVFIHVPTEELKQRSIQRWLTHGRSLEQAEDWVRTNDLPNIETVQRLSRTKGALVYEQGAPRQ